VRRSALIVALLTLGVVPLLAGCGTTEASGGGGGGQKTVAGLNANDHGTKTASNEIKVELDDYYFEPTVIQGKAGQKVTLELDNEGSVEHNFTLAAQNIDQTIQPGEDAKVTVTIPKSGAVSFFCKFHKSEGMAGALVVKGQSAAGGGMPGGTTTNNGGGGGGYGY
jgi:plastocyanin